MFDSNTRVLVADDMVTMRKIVMQSCRALGLKDITEVLDGLEAWEAIQSAQEPFGLVISDWNMPKCTGLELLRHVRGDERFKSLPFIFLTAENEVGQVTEALKLGADNYILKPFTQAVFSRKIEETHKRWLNKKKAADQ